MASASTIRKLHAPEGAKADAQVVNNLSAQADKSDKHIPINEKQARDTAAPPPAPRGGFRISRRQEATVEYQADLPALMSVLEGAEALDRTGTFQAMAGRERLQQLIQAARRMRVR